MMNKLKANQMSLNYSFLNSLCLFHKNRANTDKRVWEIFSSIADYEHASDLNRLRIADFTDSSDETTKSDRNCSDMNRFVCNYPVIKRDSMRCELLKNQSFFRKTFFLIYLFNYVYERSTTDKKVDTAFFCPINMCSQANGVGAVLEYF